MSTFSADGIDLAATARLVGQTMEPWMRDFEGYAGLMILTDQSSGTARMITFWESQDAAERSRHGRLKMRDQLSTTIGVRVESTEPYEVAFRDRF